MSHENQPTTEQETAINFVEPDPRVLEIAVIALAGEAEEVPVTVVTKVSDDSTAPLPTRERK